MKLKYVLAASLLPACSHSFSPQARSCRRQHCHSAPAKPISSHSAFFPQQQPPWRRQQQQQKQQQRRWGGGKVRRFAIGEEGGLDDLLETSARPKFKGLGDDDGGSGGAGGGDGDGGKSDYKSRAAARRRARRTNVNERLLNEIAEIEQSRPKRESDLPEDVVAPILGYKEDLDGVNPFFAVFGSLCVWAAAFGMWSLTQWLAYTFATNPLGEDTFYVIQRIATIVRTCVVGGAALGAGIFGLTGLGLFLMGARVGVGVATGELDMAKRSNTQIDQQFKAIKDLLDQ